MVSITLESKKLEKLVFKSRCKLKKPELFQEKVTYTLLLGKLLQKMVLRGTLDVTMQLKKKQKISIGQMVTLLLLHSLLKCRLIMVVIQLL
jgi:hypothetical protein